MRIKPPQEGVMGAVPEAYRTDEERFWLEQAEIDDWLAKVEAGEDPPPVALKAEWSTVKEVAARHKCATKTIRKAIHSGQLAAVNHAPKGSDPRSSRYRIHRDAEVAWIKSKGAEKREVAKRKAQAKTTFKGLIQ